MSKKSTSRKNPLVELADLPEHKIMEGVTGHLSFIFRRLLVDMGIKGADIAQFLDMWSKDPRNSNSMTESQRSTARSNISRALAHPAMTFRQLLKGSYLIRIKSLRIDVYAESVYKSKGTKVISLNIPIAGTDIPNMNDESDESAD